MELLEPGITRLSKDPQKADFFQQVMRSVTTHADEIAAVGEVLHQRDILRMQELDRQEQEREKLRAAKPKKRFGRPAGAEEVVASNDSIESDDTDEACNDGIAATSDTDVDAKLDDVEDEVAPVEEEVALPEEPAAADVSLQATADDFSFIRDVAVREFLALLPYTALCEAKALRSAYHVDENGILSFQDRSASADMKAHDAEIAGYIVGTCLDPGMSARMVYVLEGMTKDGHATVYPFDGCSVSRAADGTIKVAHAVQPEAETWWYVGCNYLRIPLYRKPGIDSDVLHAQAATEID